MVVATRLFPKIKEELRHNNIAYLEANGNIFLKNNLSVTPFDIQDSSMLSVLAASDCLIIRPPNASPECSPATRKRRNGRLAPVKSGFTARSALQELAATLAFRQQTDAAGRQYRELAQSAAARRPLQKSKSRPAAGCVPLLR